MNRIQRYRLLDCIWTGQHTHVFRAIRVADDEPVIVKRLKAELPPAAEVDGLEHEFELVSRLDLPGVIVAHELEREGNTRQLVFEDFGGRALSAHLSEQDHSVASCLRLAVRLTEILRDIHAAGVIHRDFNPANIVWNPDTGQLKLIDFGLALNQPFESPGFVPPAQVEGTLAFLAPEQTGRMNRSIDGRADLYALGATLYAVFTGKPPFTSEDPLELVHAHMARPPVPLRDVRSDVPQVVSDIVMKLLMKDPDGRFQTARGVLADLERCLEGLGSDNHLEPFPLAQDDVSARFQISQRLYGRGTEIGQLLAAYERTSVGAAELVLVAGYSGSGKTSLVHEVHKPITEKHGHFASGKFNQYQQNTPYSAFQQALSQFFHYALAEGELQVRRWRREILEAVGDHGQLLIDAIPSLEWLIGKQPPVEAISPVEAAARFNRLVRALLGVLCRPEHPMTLFIDDLQWADAASIQLLKQIFADKSLGYLLVVCAYRENEMDASHPFMVALEVLRRQAVPITLVTVKELSERDLVDLIADTLHDRSEQASKLAALVHRKTQGNPFFAKTFLRMLHDENLLRFDASRQRWSLDMALIREQAFTDNVVDLLARKVRRLPQDVQDILALAASVGSRFDLETLSIISQRAPEVCVELLMVGVAEELVLALDENYHLAKHQESARRAMFRFQHDRVQQAAYALILPEDLPRVHRMIGRLLLDTLGAEQRAERVFEVADHVNAGRSLTTGWEELLELVAIDLEAAGKAKGAMAHRSALGYLQVAFEVVEDPVLTHRLWDEHHDLAMALYKQRAELEYLNGDFATSEQFIRAALDHASTPIEKVDVLYALIVQHTLQAKYDDAISNGRRALAVLGIELPNADYDAARDEEIRLVRQAIGERPVASLFDLPLMHDLEKCTAAKLLITMGPPCYRSHQRLWSVIVPKVVNLVLAHGNIPQVGYCHTAFGGLLGYVSNDYETAIQFGELATRLMAETFAVPSEQSVFHLMIGSSLRHWSKHLKFATLDYLEAYQIGLRSSNLQYAAYAFGHNMYCRFYQGAALGELLEETARSLEFSRTRHNQWAIDLLEGGQIVFGTLTGAEPAPFCKGALTEADFLARCDAHRNTQVACIYKILRTFALYVEGDYERAFASSAESNEVVFTVGTQGLLPWAEHVFLRALIIAAVYSSRDPREQALLRAELRKHLEQIRVWADHAPDNFEHKWCLVSAECARIEDRPLEAMDLYDRAIAAALDQGFVQIQAIANECAARFWLERDKGHLAQSYVQRAHYAYGLWGATPKVRSLEARLGEWLWPDTPDLPGVTSVSTSQPLLALDVATLVSTARSLAETVQLQPLLEKLMYLALAHAGADAGVLLMHADGEWVVQARGDLQGVAVLQAVPVQPELVPLSILLFTARSQVPLTLSEPDTHPAYANDPYLKKHHPKSLCCLPLLHRGSLIGMLYLENMLASRVFAPEQMELLGSMSSQMAGAIVNARLYDNLERAVERRTAELHASELRFKTMFDQAPMGIAMIDSRTGEILMMNQMFAKTVGVTEEDRGDVVRWGAVTELDLRQTPALVASTPPRRGSQKDVRYDHPDGRSLWLNVTTAPLDTGEQESLRHLSMLEDITLRKEHEVERESMISQLQKALAEVKTLRGFIPICASCKKIRDDRGFWNQIETYISEHSEAMFSHGICPDCEKKLYPEF